VTGTGGSRQPEPPDRAHLSNLSRVYSDETWRLYDELDRSLNPRSPDWLHRRAAELIPRGAVILDAGCRDAEHLIRLVQAHDATGVGIEPVAIHVERARAAVAAAGLQGRVRIVHGRMEDCDYPDEHFDFIWCRDVLEQVDPLPPFLQQCTRVLKPNARTLAFTNVTTDRLEPAEAALLRHHMGNVHDNLIEANLIASFEAAGLAIEERDSIGTEWREFTEERTQPVSKALLRLARLRRRRTDLIATHGEDIYNHVEANLHWELFQFLGKLEPVVFTLRKT
jgi:SAM-dependent methyltransferase